MTGPVWLGTVIGAVVLLAAAVALARLVAAWRLHRPTDAQVDIHNVLMGVSMAGVLIPQLLVASGAVAETAWRAVWILVTLWFVVSVARDAVRGGSDRLSAVHHIPHLVMSAAMVYMFAADSLIPLAVLAYAFTVFMVGYVVLVVDRLPVIATAGMGNVRVIGRVHASPAAAGATAGVAALPVAPRLAAATNVVLALAMGYMLVLLLG